MIEGFDILVQGLADKVDRDILKGCGRVIPKTDNQKRLERAFPVLEQPKKNAKRNRRRKT